MKTKFIKNFLWLGLVVSALFLGACSKEKSQEEDAVPSSIEVVVEKGALEVPTKLYLRQISGEEDPLLVDSLTLEDGKTAKFSFKPSQAGFYILNLGEVSSAFALLDTIGKTEISINNNSSDKLVVKNANSKAINEIDSMNYVFEMEMQQLGEMLQTTPRELVEVKADSLSQAFDRSIKKKALSLKPSIAAVYAVEYLDKGAHLGFLDSLIRELKVAHPYGNKIVIGYAEKVQALLSTNSGQKAPDISQNTENGKKVSLTDFKGKYVLLDFWASWCGPCRKESPNLVAFYNRTKDNKNFSIWSISLDEDRTKWLEAVKKDKLTWLHTSDLKGWNNEIAKAFMVSSIPHTVLIGPDGVIIARNESLETYEKIIKTGKAL